MQDLDLDGMINIKIDFEEMGWKGVPWIQEVRIGTISMIL